MGSAEAAVRHTDVSLNTYVDFATNSGRYVDGVTNAMLDYIRQRDGGVKIEYTGGQTAYTLPHGMISFDSVADDGNMTVVGYSYVVTVAHNSSQMSPTFSGHDYGIGDAKAIKYLAVEEYGSQKNFVNDIADYKLSRLTKLVTDAPVAQMAGGSSSDYKGQLVYRTAGGYQKIRDAEGKSSDETEKLTYQVGGIGSINSWNQTSVSSVHTADISGTTSWGSTGVGEGSPLPFGGQQGDSGSPYFVWDGSTESFKLLMVHSASYDNRGYPEKTVGYEATDWARQVMESDTVRVDMSRVKGNLYINGIQKSDDKGGVTDTVNGVEYTVQPAKGYLTHDDGTLTHANWDAVSINGIENGQHTWKSLSGLKDTDVWYAYGNEYLNATESVVVQDKDKVAAEGVTYSRLFMTQNLEFEAAADNAVYTIKVTADTDMGAGYVHFAANGKKDVTFNVESDKSYQLDSAGYVVDAGVQVNMSLRNWDSSYMREWRKVGEGTLNICGKNGNNEIFLNVGGTGKTLLNQSGGYAAYNVLVNTGSTVVIKDTSQICRDLTFGNGGGVLDMNGNSMAWYTTNGQTRTNAFTINALTEEAVITNGAATHAELTYMESGDTRFVGSFRDSKDSSLGITYSVEGGTWELNGIRTCLTNENSGLTIEKGTVKLAGTLTVHGHGTVHTNYGEGDTADFSTRANDWHYADAAINVTVKDKATFELESHARLTGTVTVESGGTYVMHEGVQHAEEYIEGGEKTEKTADVAAYYGHKGDVKLAEGAKMKVTFGADTDTDMSYSGSVSGPGSLTFALGTDKAAFHMKGSIDGVKSLVLESGSKVHLYGSVDVDSLQVGSGSELILEEGADITVSLTSLVPNGESNATKELTLQQYGGDDKLVMLKDSFMLEVLSDALNGVSLKAGGVLSLNLTTLGDVSEYDYIRLSLAGLKRSTNVASLSEDALVTATLANGQALTGYYVQGETGSVYFAVVPEPATGTLSLLALSLMCSRRRRR